MKKIYLLIIVLFLFSCSRKQESAPRVLEIPERIISLAPSITEILFAIGANDKLVGVTSYCDYPHEALKIEKIGEFQNISIEKLLSLKSDVIIGTKDGNPIELITKLRKLGLQVETVEPATIQQIYEAIINIGKITGKVKEAETLCNNMKKDIEQITAKLPENKHRVLLLYGSEPFVAAGTGCIGDELICLAGGKNAASDCSEPYVVTNIENIIAMNPDIILELAMGTDEDSEENIKRKWINWQSISAVKNKRIFALDSDLICRAGPRIVKGLQLIAEIINKAANTDPSEKK
ncbi:MAG: cobalamin-binding protein [Planctomycetota bacterium]